MINLLATGKRAARIVLAFILALLLTLLIILLLRIPHDDWRQMPLPNLQQQPLRLRVVYASNPRFAEISAQQLQDMLAITRTQIKHDFDLDVDFEIQKPIEITELFSHLPAAVKAQRRIAIANPQTIDDATRMQMRNTLLQQLQSSTSGQKNLMNFSRPHLLNPASVTDLTSLAQALVDTQINRLQYWYDLTARDGKPVIDGSQYNQWVWWDSLGYGELPYDIVITNQLVASLETYDVAIHSALRGGITGGTMTYSKHGRYGGYVFVSVFALINDYPLLTELRADTHYSVQQVTQYTAATLTHELGHLFFHYDHPFGVGVCVMSPTPLLHYRAWYDGLDAAACRALQLPQMQPGAADLNYNAQW